MASSCSMAYVAKARRARKSHAPAAPSQMPRTQSGRERVGVHARQLALKPHLPELRRHRRSLLRRLEQAQKSTLARHVHRTARLAASVLISESWYKRYGQVAPRPAIADASSKRTGTPLTHRQVR